MLIVAGGNIWTLTLNDSPGFSCHKAGSHMFGQTEEYTEPNSQSLVRRGLTVTATTITSNMYISDDAMFSF